MRKIFQYILMAVAVVVTASCSNELDEALQPAGNGNLQFVVGDFPTFGEGTQTRVIGTQDEGKTAWEVGDQIIITLTSQKFSTQSAAITYDGTSWSTAVSLSYLENEVPTVSVIYAPCYEVTKAGVMRLKEGMQLGMSEYLVGDYEMEDGVMNITFEGAGASRNYSRLRIAGLANQTLTVTTTDFIPAGMNESDEYTYTLTTDEKGNAYLYGIFAEGATVSVKKGVVTLAGFTFSEDKDFSNGTEQGKSYALDAIPVIDGTLGGMLTATEYDVNALVEKLEAYVDNGITTITVTGSKSPIINMDNYTTTAIGEAIYRLSGSGNEANSTYLGKIDLILPDVTEIVEQEFLNAYALNSITLPNVTKLGYQAFYDCQYLKKIIFGSVVKEGTPKAEDFLYVGKAVGGCDLVLNREQANAATEYQPNLDSWQWWNTQWNSISLE